MTDLLVSYVLVGGPYDGFMLVDCPHHGDHVCTRWETRIDVNLLGENGCPAGWRRNGDSLQVTGFLDTIARRVVRTAIYRHTDRGLWVEEHAFPAYA